MSRAEPPQHHLAVAWRSVRDSARQAPGVFTLWMAMTLAQAAMPAAQVLVIRALTGEATRRGGHVAQLVLLAAVVLWCSAVAGDGFHALASVVSRRASAEAKARVVDAMSRLTPQELASEEMSTRAKAARDAADEHVLWHARSVVQAAQGLLGLALLLTALWPLSPGAACLLVMALLVGIPFISRIGLLESRAFARIAEHTRHADYYADQLVYQRTASELVALGTGARVARLARARYLASWSLHRDMMLRTVALNVVSGGLTSALAGGALWLVATSGSGGPGGAAAGVVAVLSGTTATFGMAMALGLVASQTGPVRALYAFVDTVRDREAVRVEPMEVDELRCRSVTFTYPGGSRPAVADATLVARRGEMIALVGLNGAGKTTLASCLAGVLVPDSGQVLVDGRPLGDLAAGQRLGAVAMLAQDFGRYELTVREAVRLGSPREDVSDEEVWSALRSACTEEIVRALPEGLDTQLGQQWGGAGLSGGQWQRLALARIALRGAPVWLLDEPTSSVDAETEEAVFADLGRQRAERITVVVSHRAWTLRAMDRIYVLDSGRIVESGTYPELMAREGAFARMFRFQQQEGPGLNRGR